MTTMTRQLKRPITQEELNRQLTDLADDLKDIHDELKSLGATRHIPPAVAPLFLQARRNAGWASGHLQNALLLLRNSNQSLEIDE